jgi:phospholipid transport system substrate-binding protein
VKNLFSVLVAAACLLLPPAVDAQELTPDALVKNVTNEVLTILRQDKDIQSGSQKRAVELVETKVLPHFNFSRMTALAVGRDWRQANTEQQKALTEEFRTLLVRTYSNALTAYKNQTVSYKPFRMQPSDTDVTVRTQIVQPGSEAVSIDYSLEKGANGWKVYDVIVGGVSLVTNYRESFAAEVRKSGIDGLIKSLQTKNSGLESAVARSEKK